MRYITPIVVIGVVVAAAATCVLIHPLRQEPTGVMLSLVGYTNTWLHSTMHPEAGPTNARIALFTVTNQTSGHTFMYFRGQLQVKTIRGWKTDENSWKNGSELTEPLRPNRSVQIEFPVPDSNATWRCSVGVFDVTYSPHGRPKWQASILDGIRRIGVNLEPSSIIWSKEIRK